MSLSRIAALGIAVADVLVAAVAHEEGGRWVECTRALMRCGPLFALIGIFCIFAADYLGAFVGSVGRGGYVSTPLPAGVFTVFGWLLLVIPGLAFLGYLLLGGASGGVATGV